MKRKESENPQHCLRSENDLTHLTTLNFTRGIKAALTLKFIISLLSVSLVGQGISTPGAKAGFKTTIVNLCLFPGLHMTKKE